MRVCHALPLFCAGFRLCMLLSVCVRVGEPWFDGVGFGMGECCRGGIVSGLPDVSILLIGHAGGC